MLEATEVCALCKNVSNLMKSHILPEFLYDRMYDGLHSYPVISLGGAELGVSRRKKGIYERLLCEHCEQIRLGQLDDYAARVLKGGVELEFHPNEEGVAVRNLDYTKFKLWEMSLLWRCGVSKRTEFTAVQLGSHAEKLRSHLMTGDPGRAHEYGCIIVRPSSYDVTKELVLLPEPVVVGGHRCYRAILGGMWWVFVVSSHSSAFHFSEGFLRADGVLQIFNEDLHSSEFLLKLGMELGRE